MDDDEDDDDDMATGRDRGPRAAIGSHVASRRRLVQDRGEERMRVRKLVLLEPDGHDAVLLRILLARGELRRLTTTTTMTNTTTTTKRRKKKKKKKS